MASTLTRSARQGVVHRPAKINSVMNRARMQLRGNVDIYLSHEQHPMQTGTCDLEAFDGSQCVCGILTVHTEQTKIPTTSA